MLRAVYSISWIHQRAPWRATKRQNMCASNEKTYRQLSPWYIPSVTIVMVCIIHAWMYLSVLSWVWQNKGANDGVHYPCTHVCLWRGVAFDQTNGRRATLQTITSHISETREIHSVSPQDTFLLGTSLWQRLQASCQWLLWKSECRVSVKSQFL